MKALLDTQILLWYGLGNPLLSRSHRDWIQDEQNDLVMSVATLWEIITKHARGKLHLNGMSAVSFVDWLIRDLELTVLPISMAHVRGVADLPPIHADPFDRILVAQAVLENIPILTADPIIGRYSIRTIS